MQSVWVTLNKALTEIEVNEYSLPTYRVLETHQMEYTFSSYGEMGEISIPQAANDGFQQSSRRHVPDQ